MAGIDRAAGKWARRTGASADDWATVAHASKGAYLKGLTTFGGVETPTDKMRGMAKAYDTEVNAISASDFKDAVEGKKSKYTKKLKMALGIA